MKVNMYLPYLKTLDLISVYIPLFNCDTSGLVFCSLYNNNICDFGAENLAKVLPAMTSLRVLE